MDILFRTSKLAKLFNDERALRRERGDRQAELIMQRMAELRAAENLEALRFLPRARCHELKGDRRRQLSVDLNHPYRLLFAPDHEPAPELPSGGLDWKQVTRIIILGVEDTHA
ncbi:MAG TPA: type II toxin-antitoxin system RelE/ParE family toxin [Candidatus Paceibacterota bacterium]|nr:type II toxin-antitoxin system RelE/ParE family toxin [Verrucomicrobiota bacterium]HRZ43766.1 type II toxin-antitoxin system RelE/ParE family toxin [Candidatus Paceibacterota bacterium]HRZ91361.1 type II toxin-antitoxin system RelE/ParE family toxin [Candidatus Paceibacterota bacterium]